MLLNPHGSNQQRPRRTIGWVVQQAQWPPALVCRLQRIERVDQLLISVFPQCRHVAGQGYERAKASIGPRS